MSTETSPSGQMPHPQEQRGENSSPFTPPLVAVEQPAGPADNIFFNNEQTGEPDGQSWNLEIEGHNATYGKIKAGTSHLHRIEGPEVVVIMEGSIDIQTEEQRKDGHGSIGYSTGMALMLPIRKDFYLTVPKKAKQIFSDTEELSYVCFYPKDSDELGQVISVAEQTLGANFVEYSREPSRLVNKPS